MFKCQLHFPISNISVNVNIELSKIHEWLTVNKLSLNIDKTKFMIFHFPQNNLRNVEIPDISIKGIKIERVSSFNFLGLTLTDTLQWKDHINIISNKISKTIGILTRIKHYVNTDILKTIYNSLICSHINYSLLCWGHTPDRIIKLQKRAVRIVAKAKYNAHTEPLFKKLELLRITDIFKAKALTFYFKFKNNQLPKYFSDMFNPQPGTHTYNTRSSLEPQYKQPKKKLPEKCVRFYIPKLIADLPNILIDKVQTHCLHGFNTYVKKHLLRQYTNLCTINNCYICQKPSTPVSV